MNIHYDQIGSLAWCEQHRYELETLMEKALVGDKDAELLVVNCAAHFYGLVIWDFDNSVPALIDAVRSMDQEMEVR